MWVVLCRIAAVTVCAGVAVQQPHAQVTEPAAPPPHCQRLLTARAAVEKIGNAITVANNRKADVKSACYLFRNYLAAEARMLRLLDTNGPECGVPAEVNQQVRSSHAKASQIGKQVCDAAGLASEWPLQGDFWTPDERERFLSPLPFN